MADYYRPFVGKIHVLRYELLKPQVVIDGHKALLTAWKAIHSHWSFTRHPALNLNPVESEGPSA